MALARTIDIARSSLSVVTDQSAVVSRNIAHAGDPGATRKITRLTTDPGYAPHVTGIVRGVSDSLQSRVLSASSDAARESAVVAGLEELHAGVGDPQSELSVAARLVDLRSALQTAAARPADHSTAAAALAAAGDVVAALHNGAATIERVRAQADEDIAAAVTDLNAQLVRLGEIDVSITSGARSGHDVTDDLDERDRILGRIAEHVGLTVIRRADQGVALYTDSGIPLYDGSVRPVTLDRAPVLPGLEGSAPLIDGVQASGTGAIMHIGSGRLAGLIELRDGIAVTAGAQLDEIARGLIASFAETDQGQPPTLPDAAGLFRAGNSSAVPPSGSFHAGLSAFIEVNPSADPARGGDVRRLRDGGIAGGIGYVYNSEGWSGFSGRLRQLVDAFASPVATAPGTELPASGSLPELAAAATGWLQGVRQARGDRSDYAQSLLERSRSAHEQTSGVNIDEQLTELMELQRSYQASSKLISTVDQMFGALLQAVG